jgi:hypothetical protein
MKKKLRVPTKTKSRGKKLLAQEGGFASKVKLLRKKDKNIEREIEDLLTKFWS